MRKAVLVLAGLAVVLAMVGCGTKVPGVPRTVAKVNGTPILSSDYLNELNQQKGREILAAMLEQEVILQWAKDLGVPATEAQVNQQIAGLKREQDYADRVKALGESLLRKQMLVQQAITNVVMKIYKITPQEVEAAYNSSMIKPRYVHGPQKRIAVIINLDKKKIDEAAEKLKTEKDFDKVGAEYAFGGNVIKAWVDPDAPNMPSALIKAIKEAPVGKISSLFSMKGTFGEQFAILKTLAERPKADTKLKSVKAEVEQIVAMQRIGQGGQSGEDFQKRLQEQKKKANIEVMITGFENVIPMVKAPPQSPMGGMGQPPMRP